MVCFIFTLQTMEMEDRNSCSRKRKPPVYDWERLFADTSSKEELERRKTPHVKKNANGCLDTVRLRFPVKVVKVCQVEKNDNQNSLAPPESGKCLLKKLEEDKDSRIVVNGLSTKSAPFKCPSPLSEDSAEVITSSADKKGSHSATSSPHCSVGDIPGSSSETNASQEDDLNKDEKAISVPEAKEQSKNEAIPENKRISGNLPTLLDDDVKNLFGNLLEAINTFGDRVVAALECSPERVYSGDEIYAMVEEMSLESPLKERAYLWLMTREKAIKSLFGAPLEKRKSLLITMMTDSSYQ